MDTFDDWQQIIVILTPLSGVLASTQLLSLCCLHVAMQAAVSKCQARHLSLLMEQGAVTHCSQLYKQENQKFTTSDMILH